MSQLKIRSSFAYHSINPDLLINFAIGIRDGIYNNPTIYNTPPMTAVIFQALINTYIDARAAYKLGGLAQKGDYELAKAALMNALDQFAEYVNGVALGNPALITEAGFTPTKGNITPVNKPDQPQLVTLTRGLPGELYADCAPVTGVNSWGGLLVADNPIPDGTGINEMGQIVVLNTSLSSPAGPAIAGTVRFVEDLNKARRKKFTGLTIGTTYYFYMWAMNAGGVSALSNVVSIKVLEA